MHVGTCAQRQDCAGTFHLLCIELCRNLRHAFPLTDLAFVNSKSVKNNVSIFLEAPAHAQRTVSYILYCAHRIQEERSTPLNGRELKGMDVVYSILPDDLCRPFRASVHKIAAAVRLANPSSPTDTLLPKECKNGATEFSNAEKELCREGMICFWTIFTKARLLPQDRIIAYSA